MLRITRWALTALFLMMMLLPAVAGAATIPLRVLTYNIWGLPWPEEHATWRYEEIAKRIDAYDVVALQEAWSTKTDVIWRKATHPHHAFGGNAHSIIGGSGLVVLSKFPIVQTEFRKFKECTGLECSSGKGIMMFRVQIKPGVEIDFYNTHMHAWRENDMQRTGQILEIIGMVEEVSIGRPVVLLGDFNFEPHTINYDEFVGGMYCRDSYADHVRRLPNPTPEQISGYTFDMNRNPWAKPEYSGENEPMRLDYVFYRDTGPIRLRVEDSTVAFTEGVRDGMPLSDHFGVSTLFSVITR